jgi:hypothetical protein
VVAGSGETGEDAYTTCFHASMWFPYQTACCCARLFSSRLRCCTA